MTRISARPRRSSRRPTNAPADGGNGIEENSLHRYFYFALTMPGATGATTTASRVCVRRTGSVALPMPGAPAQDHDAILPIACTPNGDASGRKVTQGYAPALAIAQGTTDGPRVELSYRSLLATHGVGRQKVMTIEHEFYPSNTPTPDVDELATVDFPLDVGQWGTRSGIAVYEKCDPWQGCPNDPNYVGADAGFASVWSDTRRSLTPRVTDTFIRAFEWQ